MTAVTISEKVTVENMHKLHDSICANNGRYKGPILLLSSDMVSVEYCFDDMKDYVNHCEYYTRLTTKIVEKKQSWLKRTLRNFF